MLKTVRVCKKLFLTTLDISERIYYFFYKKFDPVLKITPSAKIQEVKSHIESFPYVQSHYCHQNSNKNFLDPTLNIQKMYRLYKEQCIESPVKENIYRKVFF